MKYITDFDILVLVFESGDAMEIKVLGITLVNMSLRESLRQTDKFLKNGALNTIAYISTQKLVQACEQEEQKNWMEELDMTICEDTDVLRAAGVDNRSRFREIEQNEYLIELLRRIKHNKYGTYLFTDTKANLNTLENELHELMSGLPIKGRGTLEEYESNIESIINDMNAVAPVIIISRFPYPQGMQMMHEYRMLLNGEIWITLPEHINALKKRPLKKRVMQRMYKRSFTKKVNYFQKDENE